MLGSFLYADGSLFARLAAAADAVVAAVCAALPSTALAGLCSPTEVFSVPAAASAAARARHAALSLHTPWERALTALSRSRYLDPNVATNVGGVLVQDSLVWQQAR